MTVQVTESRVNWIDSLKAIGIYLMVLGHHETIAPGFLKYIYSLHMPLFFFVSGFLLDRNKYPTIKNFVFRRTQTLLVRYFLFLFVSYIFWFALLIIRHPDQIESENNELFQTFLSIFISSNGISQRSHNSPLWFLTCLFLLEIQFYVVLALYEMKALYEEPSFFLLFVLFRSVGTSVMSTFAFISRGDWKLHGLS